MEWTDSEWSCTRWEDRAADWLGRLIDCFAHYGASRETHFNKLK